MKKSKIFFPPIKQLQVPRDRPRNLVSILTEILQISDTIMCFKMRISFREIKKQYF
jgi:hypothetical protein